GRNCASLSTILGISSNVSTFLSCQRTTSLLNDRMKSTSRIFLVFLCFDVSAHAADQSIALKAARMFDGKSNALVQNAVVIVQGDKIVDAGSNLPIPGW